MSGVIRNVCVFSNNDWKSMYTAKVLYLRAPMFLNFTLLLFSSGVIITAGSNTKQTNWRSSSRSAEENLRKQFLQSWFRDLSFRF